MRSNETQSIKNHTAIVDSVPADQVCVVYLGGNGTVDKYAPEKQSAEEVASGDAKRIREEIVKPFFNDAMGGDIPVYAIAYDFDDYGGHIEINHDTGHFVLEINEKNLRYCFNKGILPKISENGEKIDIAKIKRRWPEYLNLLFSSKESEKKFDIKLNNTLRELNYTDFEINQIEELVKFRKKSFNNEHITDLFNRVILPRITHNGKRVTLDDALRKIRKITFSAHCYGALLVRKIQDEMRKKMPELGYSSAEIKNILDQMLVVAHAPSGRLDKQTKSFYSFASAFDNEIMTPNNKISSFIKKHRFTDTLFMQKNNLTDMEHTWMPNSDYGPRAAFLPQNMGNMFLIARGFDSDGDAGELENLEHSNTHYVKQSGQNKHGQLLNHIARNVFVNGIKNSLAQDERFTPIPNLEDLIRLLSSTPEQREKMLKLFEQMQKNGKIFLQNILEEARTQITNQHNQQNQVQKPSAQHAQ